MNIVSLKHDSVFREVMSYESIRKQLISDVTGIPLETIKEVRLVSPFLRKVFWWQKQGILDAAMVLQNGTKIDVELQVRNQENWVKRKLFYLAKMYTDNLRVGQDYRQLKKCICISILGFQLVEGEEYHTAYSLRDGVGRELTDLFELHIVELNKPLRDGDAMNDWIRLFNTETMEGLDMIRTKNAGVAEAVEVVRRMSLGRIVREIYESYMKAKMDRRAEDEFVRNEGRAEGKVEGRAEGRVEGRAEGRVEGRAEGRAEGRTEGEIQGIVETCQDLGVSQGETLQKLMGKLSLTEDAAKEQLEKYWH